MFLNTLTANDNYPVEDCGNLSSAIQKELSLKPNIFCHFVVPFLESTSNFEDFQKKKMILIASLFWKLQTVKDLLRRLFKKHSFGDPRLENISLSDMLNLRGLS